MMLSLTAIVPVATIPKGPEIVLTTDTAAAPSDSDTFTLVGVSVQYRIAMESIAPCNCQSPPANTSPSMLSEAIVELTTRKPNPGPDGLRMVGVCNALACITIPPGKLRLAMARAST